MPNKTVITDFFKDINENNQNSESISKFVPQLNRGIVQAWKIVYDANLHDEGYKKDYKLLKNISVLRGVEDTKLLCFLDSPDNTDYKKGDAALKTILQKNKYAPCNTCDATNKNTYLNDIAQYVADIGYFTRQYRDKNGADRVVDMMKGIDLIDPNPADWKIKINVEGNAFMLRSIYQKGLAITEFEKYEPVNVPRCFKCSQARMKQHNKQLLCQVFCKMTLTP